MKYKYAILSLMIMFLCIISVITISCTCSMYETKTDNNLKYSTEYNKSSVNYITSNKIIDTYDYVEEVKRLNNESDIPFIEYYTEDDVQVATEILYNEARGVDSVTNIANVVWCILNRYDTGDYGSTINEVMTSPYQFAYTGKDYSMMEEFDYLYGISSDVFYRWNQEKNGVDDVGRTLPSDYLWFHGNGEYNIFRNSYDSTYATSFTTCNWLISLYES